MKIIKSVSFLIIILTVTSCVSKNKMTYIRENKIKNLDELSSLGENTVVTPASFTVSPPDYRIMPYDNLFISVSTPDPQWSAMFNSGGDGGSGSGEGAAMSSYPVDSEGYIKIPFVGKVKVAGESLNEINTRLDLTFKSYVTNASIIVRLVNSHISIIGEVARPGKYALNRDRINIFEALAMAGDLSDYSDRKHIQLIRRTSNGTIVKEIPLNDRIILTSEYYYVMPNDIIYAPPLKGKSFQMNASIYTIAISLLNTVMVVIALSRN